MKLNATLLFQIGNFFILYWFLKRFFLQEALSFLTAKRKKTSDLHAHVKTLEIEKTKLIQEHQEIISSFQNTISQDAPISVPLDIKKHVQQNIVLTEKILPESEEIITQKLINIIQKECTNEP